MGCQKVKWLQIWESTLDPKVWIIAITMGQFSYFDTFLFIASDALQTGAAYHVTVAVSGFGTLVVTTCDWAAYQSLLWQMSLGSLCFDTILLIGYLSLRMPNISLLMLVRLLSACHCRMCDDLEEPLDSSSRYVLAGYILLAFFAPVTSLIVSMGMAKEA